MKLLFAAQTRCMCVCVWAKGDTLNRGQGRKKHYHYTQLWWSLRSHHRFSLTSDNLPVAVLTRGRTLPTWILTTVAAIDCIVSISHYDYVCVCVFCVSMIEIIEPSERLLVVNGVQRGVQCYYLPICRSSFVSMSLGVAVR